MFARVVAVLTPILVVAVGSPAPGQGVGGNSPTQTVHPMEVALTYPEAPYQWVGRVGSVASPLGVQLDPDGPVWSKELRRDYGAPLLLPQQVVRVGEYLIVQGDLPWTGWNIEIASEAFEWLSPSGGGLFDVATYGGGSVVTVPGLQTSLEESRVCFSFDALAPGTKIQIIADMSYAGAAPFSGSLYLRQYPVPEPSFALLVGPALALGALRRRVLR